MLFSFPRFRFHPSFIEPIAMGTLIQAPPYRLTAGIFLSRSVMFPADRQRCARPPIV